MTSEVHKTLLKDSVKFWYENGSIKAEFDKNKISEMDAVELIDDFIQEQVKLMEG